MKRLPLASAIAALLVPLVAYADAMVSVQLYDSAGRPVDGTVTLVAANGQRVTCQTVGSRCQVSAPGGTYTATVQPTREHPPAARSVTVPASGSTTLTFRTSATATPARPATSDGSSADGRSRTASGGMMGMMGGGMMGGGMMGGGMMGGGMMGGMSRERTSSGAVNIERGERVVAQGQVLDSAGRPADATLTITQNGQTLGTVRSVGGRFTIYDLERGTYQVVVRAARGGTVTTTLRIGSSVERPTFRLP